MRTDPMIALAFIASACGGSVASNSTSPLSDGGSVQTTGGGGTGSTAVYPTNASGTTTAAATSSAASTSMGAPVYDAGFVTDPDPGDAACTISPSNYDQSCTVDSDCVLVMTGNWCGTGCFCATGTINVGAQAAFNAAVAQTPVGSHAFAAVGCPCPLPSQPCCRQGNCTQSCQ